MKTFVAVSVATTVLASVASAQQQYYIDPNSVPESLRDYWCQQQTTQCPLICLQTGSATGTTTSNTCDASALSYSCVCDNGIAPNVTQYTQTLPFFLCQEWGNQCVSNCGNDATCASACRQDHPCGAQSPIRANTSTLTSTMSSTASGSSVPAGASVTGGQTVYTGLLGASASATGGSSSQASSTGAPASGAGRAAALQMGQTWGFVVLAAGFFGGAAILL